jgi:hypothetical protein
LLSLSHQHTQQGHITRSIIAVQPAAKLNSSV